LIYALKKFLKNYKKQKNQFKNLSKATDIHFFIIQKLFKYIEIKKILGEEKNFNKLEKKL
jgi:hypothetical protein